MSLYALLANRYRMEEPTCGLEPLTCSLRVINRALQAVAEPAFLGQLLFSALTSVAPYCARGGVRRRSWSLELSTRVPFPCAPLRGQLYSRHAAWAPLGSPLAPRLTGISKASASQALFVPFVPPHANDSDLHKETRNFHLSHMVCFGLLD